VISHNPPSVPTGDKKDPAGKIRAALRGIDIVIVMAGLSGEASLYDLFKGDKITIGEGGKN